MLIELVILACLLKDPARCDTFRVPFQPGMSMHQCAWHSQLQAAHWAGEHPEWLIRKFSCALPGA